MVFERFERDVRRVRRRSAGSFQKRFDSTAGRSDVSSNMRIRVRMFAICREKAGADRAEVEVLCEDPRVCHVLEALAECYPSLSDVLPAVRVAVNQAFAEPDTPIGPDDEIALIPPVSGGTTTIALRDTPISIEEVERMVRHGGAGAVVSFTGTVRDHTGLHDVVALEYEAYPEMAERVLRQIGEEVVAEWPKARVAVLHRVGRLEVGEVSVAIAVSSPHRADAFAACRQVIERLKEDVPIWKRELRRDGSVWVGMGS